MLLRTLFIMSDNGICDISHGEAPWVGRRVQKVMGRARGIPSLREDSEVGFDKIGAGGG